MKYVHEHVLFQCLASIGYYNLHNVTVKSAANYRLKNLDRILSAALSSSLFALHLLSDRPIT